jgi:hypothetical protein
MQLSFDDDMFIYLRATSLKIKASERRTRSFSCLSSKSISGRLRPIPPGSIDLCTPASRDLAKRDTLPFGGNPADAPVGNAVIAFTLPH